MDLLQDIIYIDSFDRFGQPAPNDDYDDDEGEDVEGFSFFPSLNLFNASYQLYFWCNH